LNKTIAIFASSRRNGNTGALIDWIADELDIEVVDLSDKDISPYDYEHKNINDDFIPLIRHLLNYQNVIFATPVYWYGPSAQMKVFIDRTSDLLDIEELKDTGRKLRDKTAFIACTSISSDADSSFLNSLKDTFSYLGMSYGGYAHANCENGYIKNNYQEDIDRFIKLVKNI